MTSMRFGKCVVYCLATVIAVCLCGCEKIDSNRIPACSVNLPLDNQALWDTYGVHGYGQSRRFVREIHEPGNFPYNALTYTGFGGILLISGLEGQDYNTPLAYDLACPVEVKSDVRVYIDSETFEAVCPECGSRYDVCEGRGRPVSGEAHQRNFGMEMYRVVPATYGGYTVVRAY